jgi:hypothetical protein
MRPTLARAFSLGCSPTSAGLLGLLHGRIIWAAVAFPSAVILREVLKDIY